MAEVFNYGIKILSTYVIKYSIFIGYCYICYATWETGIGGSGNIDAIGSFGLSVTDAMDMDTALQDSYCYDDYITVSNKQNTTIFSGYNHKSNSFF